MKKDNWLQTAFSLAKDSLKVKKENDKVKVFDVVRKRWVTLTKEEQIRQLLLVYLIAHKNIPIQKIAVEKRFKINSDYKRFDVAVFDNNFNCTLLIEVKNEEQNIFSDQNRAQLLVYQRVIKAKGVILTNGNDTLGYLEKESKILIFNELSSLIDEFSKDK